MAGKVLFAYNEYGQPTYNWQSHAGAVNVNTMAEVEYTCGLAGTVRPAGLIPRNEPAFAFICGAADGMADGLGRVAAIRDDDGGSLGDTLAEYAYLGLGRIVLEDYPEPEVRLDYDSGTPGDYAGFDRFGRVIDHRWYAYAASTDRDRYNYGYDRASNRLYRENTLTTGRDELYGYDQVNRLIGFQRGELNANKDGIIGTPAGEEDWSLDMTGNWPGFVQKTSGSTDLEQGRTHNPVNEITAITAATGTKWADPIHDRAGNMTSIPKPANLADGLNRRIKSRFYASCDATKLIFCWKNTESWAVPSADAASGCCSTAAPC